MLSVRGSYSRLEYINTLAFYLLIGLAVTETLTIVLNNSLKDAIFARYSEAASDSGHATARLDLEVSIGHE